MLLKNYPHFAAIFMGKQLAAWYDEPAQNQLPFDRRDDVSPNGDVLHTDSSLAKSSKIDHLHMKVKEQALRANAEATIDFATTTLKKTEQIAPQNTFNLCTLEDKLITCDLARQWLLLRKTQELANLKAEVVANADVAFVASNVHAPHHLEFVAPQARHIRHAHLHQHQNSKS
jgi:hypothetical protein